MHQHFGRWMKAGATTAVAALALTACGNGDGGNGDGGNGDGEAQGTITLGYIPGWPDGVSQSYLWQSILEDEGYDVEIEDISEAAVLYTGLSEGDIDVYPSAWPEVTHADYMDEYGDDLEDLGAYYQDAVLTFAVPEYTDIDSIEELPDNADMFDGEIIGIEPGAGHMGVTQDEVMPTYGLEEDYTLVESSTASMLTELEQAVNNEEDIVVTLWHPFWANAEYPVKDLEDPESALGEPETLNFIANDGFSEEFPDVAEWMGNLEMTVDEQSEFEEMIVNEYEGNEAEGADAWVEENSDVVDSLIN